MISKRSILCIDFKSFYASCECIDRGLNPFTTKLVVADISRGKGTIVLAVSPALKELGVPSRLRVYDLPNIDNIVFAKPRMSRYLEISSKAISIFLRYVSQDDIHVYSIDESFIDLTHYLKLYQKNEYELAKEIQNTIFNELGLTVTIGIGNNLFMSKVALDVDSKHAKDGIANWQNEEGIKKLHKVKTLREIWSIGLKMEKRLNAIGLYSINDIAHTNKTNLIKEFGVIGGELYEHANGIDTSDIREKCITNSPLLSIGQVLMRDYKKDEGTILIKEMCNDLVARLRKEKKLASQVSLSIRYSKSINGGFCHQTQLEVHSDDYSTILESFLYIYNKYILDYPIRIICLSIGKLITSSYYQPTLFDTIESQEKQRSLNNLIDQIKNRFGQNSIFISSQLLPGSTALERHNKIGGHSK